MNKNKKIHHHWLAGLVLAAGILTSMGENAGATVSKVEGTVPNTVEAPRFLGGIALKDETRSAPGNATSTTWRPFDRDAIVRYFVSPPVQPAYLEIDPIHTATIIPGVFGSVAIPMQNFPVSTRWRPIYRAIQGCANGRCSAGNQRFSEILQTLEGKGFREKLDVVNRGVNGLVTYRRDKITYKKADYWATPSQTLKRKAGDCEDFAILKMAALLELGIPARSMALVILQDQSMGVFHAVLSVSTGSGTFILDNVRNAVLKDTSLPSYVPLYSFSTDRAWIHGSKAGSSQNLAFNGGLEAIAPGEGTVRVDRDRGD